VQGPCLGSPLHPVSYVTLFLLLLLVALMVLALPTWPYSRGWGYYPSGGLGLALLVVLLLMMSGTLHW
jgi:hypothetical protein